MPAEVGWEWKSTGWWVKPRNAREVMAIIGSIGVHSTGQQFAWRGMSSADYDLASSLQRRERGDEAKVRRAEVKLIDEARAWGLGIHSTGHVDDMQLLSDLQHYGIATRLLDVTSNPMTALWFASQSPGTPDAAKTGLLLALNVTGWPRHSTVRGPGPGSYDEVENPTSARLAAALEQGRPFIIESASPNDRLRAQEGFFVAGAIPTRETLIPSSGAHIIRVTPFASLDIDFQSGDSDALYRGLREERGVGAPGRIPFVAIFISSNLKAKLLRYLEGTYNRSARVLFPDYAGFLEFGQSVPGRNRAR